MDELFLRTLETQGQKKIVNKHFQTSKSSIFHVQ